MRVFGALVVAGLFAGLGLVGCQSEEERKTQYSERAEAYFEDEEWEEAKIEFLNLIQVDPENAEARYKLAETQWKLGEFGDAIWQYREAVRLAPENLDHRLQLARVELAASRLDAVRDQIGEILERDPDHVDALTLRARLKAREGDEAGQMEDLDRALELDPENTTALVLKAQVLAQQEKYDDSEKVLLRLAESEPKAASYLLLARLYLTADRPDDAGAALVTAVEKADNPGAARAARISLANFHLSRNEVDKAERALLEARDAAPDDGNMLAALARFYVSQDQRDKAVALLEERAAGDPDEPGHLLVLAEFLQSGGDTAGALAATDRALAIDPAHEASRLARAELLIEAAAKGEGDGDEGRRIIDEVLEANPSSVLGMFSKAKMLMADREYEEAAALARRVVEERPTASAHLLLGTAYQRTNQFDLAREELIRALQLDATRVSARRRLALIYLRNGNFELAAQEARRGLSNSAGDPQLQLLLADALIGQRNQSGAREALEALEPESSELAAPYRIRAAQLLLRLGETERATEIAKDVVAKDPTNAAALTVLLGIQARSGNPQETLPALNAAIEADPKNGDLYRVRGQFYLGFRRQQDGAPRFPNEARADLLQALELNDQDGEAHVLLGQLREAMGNTEQALESYARAIELNPRHGEAYLRAGTVYERTDRAEEAIRNYTSLVQLGDGGGVPERQLGVAMNNLAWLLAEKENAGPNDLDRALELAQSAKELLPADPNVSDTLGWVMYKRRVHGAAISLFREAIASYPPGTPSRALSRYHLALSYEANGEKDLAIQELEKSLAEAGSFPGREDAEAALQRLQTS